MNSPLNSVLLPIDRQDANYARLFASEQGTAKKGKQVYLNTLAVCAVHRFLKIFDVQTSLAESNCWHRGHRAIFDAADLKLSGIGKLECRPILPGQTALTIPPEAVSSRLGCVAVQFGETLEQVKLVGFLAAKDMSPFVEIPLSQLQPLDRLFETLEMGRSRFNWPQWMQELWLWEWQPTALNLAPSMRSAYTSEMKQGKTIQLGEEQLLLAIAPPESDAEPIQVQLWILPQGSFLPPNLEVSLLDENGSVPVDETGQPLRTRTGAEDRAINFTFACQNCESFSIQFVLGDAQHIEPFTA